MDSFKFKPGEFKGLIKSNINKVDQLHKRFTRYSNLLGYIGDTLHKIEPYWSGLADSSANSPEFINTLDSGHQYMLSLGEGLDNIQFVTESFDKTLTTLASSADTILSTSASISMTVPVMQVDKFEYQPCPFLKQEAEEHIAKQLEKIDPDLGDTYRQTWETLHGTRSEPERTALFQIRQTFDHLFEVLAPDKNVYKSKFWKPKEGEKPSQIIRRERIEYAAHTHIKDKYIATLLSANATAILDTYRKLNKAHKRGKLNPDEARNAIFAIDRIIRLWVDALN